MLSLNVVLFNLFVGIVEMRQGSTNQNNILLDYYYHKCQCHGFHSFGCSSMTCITLITNF
jgi:hypothetical protein